MSWPACRFRLKRIRRVVSQVGNERVAEREAAVERFKEMDLPKQQIGSTAVDPPQIAVTEMDGGRYQRRDHFGEKDRPAREKHWREDKVGCLLSMSGATHESDPTPELPEWLATSSAVAELAKMAEKQGVFEASEPVQEQPAETSDEASVSVLPSWFRGKSLPAAPRRNRSVGSWPPELGRWDFPRPNVRHLLPTAPMRIGPSNANISATPLPFSI